MSDIRMVAISVLALLGVLSGLSVQPDRNQQQQPVAEKYTVFEQVHVIRSRRAKSI